MTVMEAIAAYSRSDHAQIRQVIGHPTAFIRLFEGEEAFARALPAHMIAQPLCRICITRVGPFGEDLED